MGKPAAIPDLVEPSLQEGFAWAIGKIPGYVQTGKTGLVDEDENHPEGTGTAAYIPSYWAGYHHRTAFYGRDFAHQATGAQIAGLHPMEAGDGTVAQYQATLAYSGILKAAGETEKADAFAAKAKQLHRYFNQEWSVISPDKPDATFACMNTRDGRKLDYFNKETSWFMPMKLLTAPGKRTDAYLDLISENVGTGLGSTRSASRN